MTTYEYYRIVEEVFEKYMGRPTVFVGKKITKWDEVAKVTGKALFTADFLKLYKDVVWVHSVRTKYSHALIKNIDVSEAVNVPGVIRVLTARDIPGVNDVGYVIPDQPLLAERKVRYIGDIVALIVSKDPYSALEAAEKVFVDYEPLPVYIDPEEIVDLMTIEEKAHSLIHDERGSDVVAHVKIRVGDFSKALREASVVVENKYRTPMQEHAYIEPEAALAVPEPDGGITVIASTQCPFDARRAIARVLGLTQNKVRVIAPFIGGGFGGKEDVVNEVGAKAALATYYTGRPAIALHTREESFIGHSKRHPMTAWYRHAAKKTGEIVLVEANILLDTGAYASLGPFVAWRATVHSVGPYKVPNARIDTLAVYTNTVYSGAFRGFGNPQVHFAVERQMDILAEELSMDPVELRLKNILRAGDRTIHGQLLSVGHGVGLEDCVRRVIELSNWYEKRRLYSNQNEPVKRGIGIALMWHGNSIGVEGADYSSVSIIINRDGTITFRTGLTEMGQGSLWGLVLIAAEILGVPPSYFRVEIPDTSSAPDSGPTVASRSTVMGGNATVVAAYKLKKRLSELAGSLLNCDPSDVVIEAPKVYCREDPSKEVMWREVVEEALWLGVPLQEYGFYRATRAEWHEETGTGAPYITYTFGAVVSEVAVDTETGQVWVERAYTAYDIGRVINPIGAEFHAVGGYVQGMGYALMEEVVHSKEGCVYNNNLSTYYIPTIRDAPQIAVAFIESGYRQGPLGAKGLGEPSIVAVAPSIANAVSHATGVQFTEIPLTPHRVFIELEKRKRRL
ncbi:MAG: xanthine dehydrogenase family protein molybdopterin-binding subunit [Sulfolobales archaeon]|nr:xanthine dehydrogenase family protein molybdopterin-binding subunit [Sulfolobales archaeon]